MSPLAAVHLFMAEQERRLRHALARHDSPSARAYTECVRPPTVIEHGTAYGYCTHKCRCAVCCQWQSERMKESRAREQQQTRQYFTTHHREYRRKRRKRGLCVECNTPVKGASRCDLHRERHNARYRGTTHAA